MGNRTRRESLVGITVFALALSIPSWAPAQAPHGWIQESAWLLLGPMGNPSGCGPGANMLLNWTAPLDVATLAPLPGDEAEIDFDLAASTSWEGVGDTPSWISLAEAGIGGNDVVDLLDIAGILSASYGETIPGLNVMAVLVTYAEYSGTVPLPVTVCDGSDDSIQIWVNDQRVQSVSACRGTDAFCSETAPAVLLPGSNVIKVLVWQGDSTWSFRLRLQREDGPVIDDEDPEVTFVSSGAGTASPPSGSITRQVTAGFSGCPQVSDALVTLVGSGAAPASVTLTEAIEGPFSVVDVTGGGAFTPKPSAVKSPVGMFEDARDVGPFCFEGSTVLNGDDSYTVTGGGVDMWTGGDEFQFAYVEATGDFEMTAHVKTRVWAPGSRWGKVGLMARQDLSDRSRYAMIQTHGEDPQDPDRLAVRPTHGGADNYEETPYEEGSGIHHDWLRLRRVGGLFTGEVSADGATWEFTGDADFGPAAPKTFLLGLAVNGHSYGEGGCVPATITFDSVDIVGGDDPPDPPGPTGGKIVWSNLSRAQVNSGVSYKLRGNGVALFTGNDGVHATGGVRSAPVVSAPAGDLGIFTTVHDIGGPCVPGNTAYTPGDGSYSVTGSGTDIWTDGDQFQFVHREVEGDFSLTAHVKARSWAAGSRWGKVGIMARQDCTATSRYAMMQTHGEDPGDPDRFAARPTHGGADNYEVTPFAERSGIHRDWMRLERNGNLFLGYFSEDGQDWQLIASMNWGAAAPNSVLLGLAVNAHSDAQAGCVPATIVFDQVQLTFPSYMLTRSLEGGTCAAADRSRKVSITGQGDPGANVSAVEEIRGPVTVSDLTGNNLLAKPVFTPFAEPSTLDPVGIFSDSRDIGAPCTAGSTVFDGAGSTTVTGGGRDIWTGGDEFQFAYTKATGDFDMVAHVAGRVWAPGSRWGKVGIMVRQNHSDRSRYAMIQTHGADPQDEDRFACRRTHEGDDNFEATPLADAEHRDWMRLQRVGNIFNGYMSLDGMDWQLFYSMDWGTEAPRTVLLGLAVNGHSDVDQGCSTASITFDEIDIVGGDGPHEPLTPLGGTITWTSEPRSELSSTGLSYKLGGRGLARVQGAALQRNIVGPGEVIMAPYTSGGLGEFTVAHDIGVPCSPGSTFYDSTAKTYTLSSSGLDIWQAGDRFQFAYKPVAGDFSFTAHVKERYWAPGSRWGKVGVMARQDCDPRSRYAMLQTHGEDLQDADRFAARPTHLGADNYEATQLPAGEHRDWMKLDRSGSVFIGSFSTDGKDWQEVARMDWGPDAPQEVLVGLAVAGHPEPASDCGETTIVFDSVKIALPGQEVVFHRADPNDDGAVNITDGIYVLNFLFLGGPPPTCRESADPNDDGMVNITDGIYILNYLFLGGPAPVDPGPAGKGEPCGPDPARSKGDLGCASYTRC